MHNGIIENFIDLRQELSMDGYKSRTDTDTETIAMVCSKFIDEGYEPIDAARKTLSKLNGSYAIATENVRGNLMSNVEVIILSDLATLQILYPLFRL